MESQFHRKPLSFTILTNMNDENIEKYDRDCEK